MGICLDTDQQQQQGSQNLEGHREAWKSGPRSAALVQTPPDGKFPMQNGGHVKFETPRVPVIFVLGGPGSGKVTHCDNLMQEKRGITHINMTDLLQQYAIGNDLKDFGQLSSKTVTEVLMLEMKMSPAAKTYLISGYPRNMRDVVEYSEKIQIVNGVLLVSWRQKVLEKQIDYGAKLGHVVLSLAKMELNNFYKNVMPVADYFDQRGMLYAVNGERNPADVYKDFRAGVLKILGMQGSVVGPITNGSVPPTTEANGNLMNGNALTHAAFTGGAMHEVHKEVPATAYKPPAKGFPPVVWVIGGPGSNKSSLCQKAVRQAPGWVHLSLGRQLRAAAETNSNDPRQTADALQISQTIASGDMVTTEMVMQLVESQITTNMSAQGIIMDGFPRDMNQVYEFESKFHQQPSIVLLDCSKLQLGRGRLDDSVAAFRRRLELFREHSLPMLKTLDNEGRLTIVDGDTDTSPVQDEFNRVILQLVEHVKRTGGMIIPEAMQNQTHTLVQPNGIMNHNLETLDMNGGVNGVNGVVPTISQRVAATNGHLVNGNAGRALGSLTALPNHTSTALPSSGLYSNGIANGRPSRDTIRQMYSNVESYPIDSQL